MSWSDIAGSVECGTLADFTTPQLIVPQLRERDMVGVIKELSKVLHEQRLVPDLLSFYHAALNHEFLVNSAGDFEIAFPHARLNGVTRACFSFGRCPEALTWASRPPRAVRFVFLLAVPATEAAVFLQLLSGLGRLGHLEQMRTELAQVETVEEILEVFSQLKLPRT